MFRDLNEDKVGSEYRDFWKNTLELMKDAISRSSHVAISAGSNKGSQRHLHLETTFGHSE